MNKKSVELSKVDLRRLKKKLRHGDRPKIAKLTGYSVKYVYACLSPNNDRINKKIVQTAIKLVEGRRPIEVEMSEELAKEVAA